MTKNVREAEEKYLRITHDEMQHTAFWKAKTLWETEIPKASFSLYY